MFIQTEDLVKAYKERNAVNGVSIRVDQGQIVGLLGPNGAGKTTTFYMIVGIERPTAGKITIDGKDITRLPIHKRAAYGIGYLPRKRRFSASSPSKITSWPCWRRRNSARRNSVKRQRP